VHVLLGGHAGELNFDLYRRQPLRRKRPPNREGVVQRLRLRLRLRLRWRWRWRRRPGTGGDQVLNTDNKNRRED